MESTLIGAGTCRFRVAKTPEAAGAGGLEGYCHLEKDTTDPSGDRRILLRFGLVMGHVWKVGLVWEMFWRV